MGLAIQHQPKQQTALESVKNTGYTRSEYPYVDARNSVVLAELTDSQKWNECLQAVLKLFHTLNKDKASPAAKDEIQTLTILLRDEISLPRFSGLRVNEMDLAFAKGVRGDYGKFYGLNAVTFNQWLQSYEADELRISSIKKQRTMKQIETGFKPKEVEPKDFVDSILRDYQNLQAGQPITTFALFFDWMYNNYDGFKPDNEAREEIIETVKPRYIANLKAELIQKYSNKEKIQATISEVENGVYTKDFFDTCKIEYYKEFLLSAPYNFEDKLFKILNQYK